MKSVKSEKTKVKIKPAILATFGPGLDDIKKITICGIFGIFKPQTQDNQLVSKKTGGADWLRFGVFCAGFGVSWGLGSVGN